MNEDADSWYVLRFQRPQKNIAVLSPYTEMEPARYPLSYGVPVRERYGSTLLPATREQHDQNCTQSH